MIEWQPISTAPKDRMLLLYGSQEPHELVKAKGKFVFVGYWDEIDQAWCATGSTWQGPFYKPVAWAERPASPVDEMQRLGQEFDAE